MRPHCSVIILSDASLEECACNQIVVCSKMSVNRVSKMFDHASLIIYGQWNAANPQSTYQQPFCGKNTTYDIASASYNFAPTWPQQSLWRLSKLPRNEVHCAVPELSCMWSVCSICPCIQFHKYACSVSQIRFFCV